jgi:CheY-like chemotaxis protein
MDGYEASREIRKRERNAQRRHDVIIALTANVLDSDKQRCEESGMDDFLSKPLRMKDLYAVIEQYSSSQP